MRHEDIHNLKRFPVIQGTGFRYLHGKEEVAVIRQCLDGESWSVRVIGKRWALPENDLRCLVYGKSMDVTYVNSEAEAEVLVRNTLLSKKKFQDWPEKTKG